MKRTYLHMLLAFTIVGLLVGFYILLSPPFKEIRPILGLPEHLYGARYNETVNAAEIINHDPEAAKLYLARVTFVYHTVFIALLYASIIVFTRLKIQDESIRNLVDDLSLIGTIITIVGGVGYSYILRDPALHGLFILGLSIMFINGLILLLVFKPKNLLDYNIWISGLLLIIGGVIGGWLGASFMNHRHDFLEALIASRFNPDLSEESLFWRALTSHEHAMIAIVLAFVFLLAMSIVGLSRGRLTRISLYLMAVGQIVMALAAYAVWPIGKIAHLIITPAAILLIAATLLLSFRTSEKSMVSNWLKIGNLVIWLGVAIPGALVAMSLRRPLILSPTFRDPAWDWAELAYNIGHWHILLLTWGLTLLVIYIRWPERFGGLSNYSGWIAIIGYVIAALSVNLYMLANGPGKYTPNPYNNPWLNYLVEPGLILVSVGVIITYLLFLWKTVEIVRS